MRPWGIVAASALAAIAVAWFALRELPGDLEWIRIATFAAIVVIAGLFALRSKMRRAAGPGDNAGKTKP